MARDLFIRKRPRHAIERWKYLQGQTIFNGDKNFDHFFPSQAIMDGRYQLLCETKIHANPRTSNSSDLLEETSTSGAHRDPKRIRNLLTWLSHAILILTSTTFFILSLRTQSKMECHCSTSPGMFSLSNGYYEPKFTGRGKTASILGDDWDRRTILRRLDGSFHRPATYKGPPSKAVDEAWAKLAPRKCLVNHLRRAGSYWF